jgi:ATP-binding cassette subfamily F protein uup
LLRSYPGAFAAYEATKARELQDEALANARAEKLLAQEEVWIRKGVEARRTRSVGRVARLVKLREQRAARRDTLGQVRLELASGLPPGKIVAELTGVGMRFGDKVLIDGFSATILRGDKVGLIGPNGSGKTTLLKLILGELQPTSGKVRQGARLQVAYFDQMRAALDLDATLADTISPGSEWIEIGEGSKVVRKHVMSYLTDFLFSPERANSPVRTLSGGERNRVLLARLFALPANVLVLDEPTNDLDIDTLELLEELLQGYAGTVFLVSHDRRFLDNVVTSLIAWEGDLRPGLWREYEGGITDWRAQRERSLAAAASARPTARGAPALPGEAGAATLPDPDGGRPPPGGPGALKGKLSFKEQRELDGLPARIEALEAEQADLVERLSGSELYTSEPRRVAELQARYAQIEDELMAALERWEALGSR